MRALDTAATGMQAMDLQVQVIAGNLANMTTTGFKSQRAEFQDLIYEHVQRIGAQASDNGNILPVGIEIGSGVKTVGTPRLMTQGSFAQTGNTLDVAIQGSGWFKILMPDGTFSYTRDGSFQMDNQGRIVTAESNLVQPTITIPPNSSGLTIELVKGLPQRGKSRTRGTIRTGADVDNSAGVPLTVGSRANRRGLSAAPNERLTLVRVFDEVGGEDSGFLLDIDGRTARMIDHRLKRVRWPGRGGERPGCAWPRAVPDARRRDRCGESGAHIKAVSAPQGMFAIARSMRFFQFKATRLDRYIVSCYDSAVGGHFHRHRDNDNVGAQHRRFAVTINLNQDYEGGDLVFPEFGRRPYRAALCIKSRR